ncbi:hypothetical protein ACQ86N_02925 [Puia sp. P3]|uniref:hypothetical protein n=1 Tax=Puia sp. P3 TaxID=3423952 RepID=UPI003D665740
MRLVYSLLLVIFLSFESSAQAQPTTLSDEYALTGALIYPAPDEAPIPDGVVIVSHGKIIAVGGKGK